MYLASRRISCLLGTSLQWCHTGSDTFANQDMHGIVSLPTLSSFHTCGLWSPSATFRLQIRDGEQFGEHLLKELKNFVSESSGTLSSLREAEERHCYISFVRSRASFNENRRLTLEKSQSPVLNPFGLPVDWLT